MKVKILFVDDEQPILQAIRRLLRDFPYEVETIANPMQALERLQEIAPDVVISDYRMPGMDGVVFLQNVAERLPDTMRLLLTGFADVAIAQEAINSARVYRFLTKPWRETELHAAIESALFELQRRREQQWVLEAERESNVLLKSVNEQLQSQLAEKEGAMALRDRVFRAQMGSTVRGLLTALDARSKGAFDRASRMAYAAVQLVEAAGQHWLSDAVTVSGLLADIGYLATSNVKGPDSLLAHCQHGASIVQSAGFPPVVAEAVRYHHENWDGSGPCGLVGPQIPYLARSLRLATLLVEALAPYKPTESLPDEAVIALLDGALGRQLDPRFGSVAIGIVKLRGSRALYPAKPPVIPELESINLSLH